MMVQCPCGRALVDSATDEWTEPLECKNLAAEGETESTEQLCPVCRAKALAFKPALKD
jgi:hypothetical protein